MYMLPGLSAWDAAEQEPPTDQARRNARAGVAWAFTIVNVRQPGIAAKFLRHKASLAAENDAYSNGVQSTLIMAGEMVPGHRYVADFCRHRPDADEPAVCDAWSAQIGFDLETRTDRYRAVLKAHHRLGEVFRYHALADLVRGLSV
jgi:hypothetical protein